MPYLAMTAAEIHASATLPEKLAWMACHFSPYGTGLSNLPGHLPENSLLILNDRTPVHGHDPERILAELTEAVEKFSCAGVLLDLQRPGSQEAAAIAKRLLTLPCPVAVSESYAGDLDCPIFLPPVPLRIPLAEYLAPWQGREIWLDAAPGGERITVTAQGAAVLPETVTEPLPFRDEELLCHYRLELNPNAAVFTLSRTRDDLRDLLGATKKYGVTTAVALWQEFAR